MIDFHSHILPGIDDGAQTVEESMEMLLSLKEQGVNTVVATPHYRCECSISRFISNRDKAYNKLMEAIKESDKSFPEIILGAEVSVSGYLLQHKRLERLCIGESNYILLEMPQGNWHPFLYNIIYKISAQYHLKVVIAHIDRYFSTVGKNKKILELVKMQPVFQINSPILDYYKGKKLIKWLDMFEVKYIFGTDCHNMDARPPLYSAPLKRFTKKHGEDFLNKTNDFVKNTILKI